MIRSWVKKIYFRLSPIRRSTDRLEKKLAEMDMIINRYENHMRVLEEGQGKVEADQKVIREILGIEDKGSERRNLSKTEQDYIHMQQEHYNNEAISPEDIVGNYSWHEEFPYETFLLYRNGDIRKPVFATTADKTALDFACGPGRMVKRMQRYFRQVDGCDISARLIEEARKRVPGGYFYVTNGNDLGDVPLEHYDFIYCTISMQHIASHKIRMEIVRQMYAALKAGGRITLQMAYNPNYPYVAERKRMIVNDTEIKIYQKQPMADWSADDFDATKTNGLYDVGIGERDIENVKADFSDIFQNVAVWFGNVSNYYKNLDGAVCCDYWATDWLFIYGEKN